MCARNHPTAGTLSWRQEHMCSLSFQYICVTVFASKKLKRVGSASRPPVCQFRFDRLLVRVLRSTLPRFLFSTVVICCSSSSPRTFVTGGVPVLEHRAHRIGCWWGARTNGHEGDCRRRQEGQAIRSGSGTDSRNALWDGMCETCSSTAIARTGEYSFCRVILLHNVDRMLSWRCIPSRICYHYRRITFLSKRCLASLCGTATIPMPPAWPCETRRLGNAWIARLHPIDTIGAAVHVFAFPYSPNAATPTVTTAAIYPC